MNKLKAALIVSNLKEGDIVYRVEVRIGGKRGAPGKMRYSRTVNCARTTCPNFDTGCKKKTVIFRHFLRGGGMTNERIICFDSLVDGLVKKRLLVISKVGKKYIKQK
jgi:hypothetical protein